MASGDRLRGWWQRPALPLALLVALVLGLGTGILVARLLLTPAPILYRTLPRLEGPLVGDAGSTPSIPSDRAAAGPPPLPAEHPVDPAAPPVDPLPAVAEAGPWGLVPRIAPDGRRPFEVYRRRSPGTRPEGPRIALVIDELGLARAPTLAAAGLPPVVGLSFSPYAPALAAWLRYARTRGHEVLVELPVAVPDLRVDPGPLAVARGEPATELLRVLARAPGAFAVEVRPPIGRPERLAPVVAELARRGLGMLEADPAARLAPLARRHRLPYAAAAVRLDREPDPMAVDFALGRLETVAEREGMAIGVTAPLPLVLERLAQWLPGLAPRGFVLVPPGQILAEGASVRP